MAGNGSLRIVGWLVLLALLPGCSRQEGVPDKLTVPAVLRQDLAYGKADAGDAEAQYMVGEAFRTGYRVTKDPGAAMAWYRKSATHGFSAAQLRLGEAYLAGTGVPLDKPTAVAWLRKAADGDEPEAQYLLGRMYLNGDGLPKDLTAAYDWLERAAAQGHAEAEPLWADLEQRYPSLNFIGGLSSMAAPGDIKLHVYRWDTAQHKRFAPPYLSFRYSVVWPVSGCPPAALARMQADIAKIFLENSYSYDYAKAPRLSAAELRNLRDWMEMPAKAIVHAVLASGVHTPTQSDNRSFSVVYQGDGILSGVLTRDSCIISWENSRSMPVSFDTRTGRRLRLADVLKPGSEAKLMTAIRKAIRLAYQLPAFAVGVRIRHPEMDGAVLPGLPEPLIGFHVRFHRSVLMAQAQAQNFDNIL